jgi:hypothetical protein
MYLDLSKRNEQKITEITHPVTGQVIMVVHTKGGVVHRDDGPAAIHYDANGNPWAQEWYVNGIAHRDNGPAKMYLNHPKPQGYESGERICEWYFNGQYTDSAALDHPTFHQHFHKGK